jgi:hypothetical protein
MRKAQKREQDNRGYVARDKTGLGKLQCDLCGKHLGWVYEFDLNESYFYCDECYDKIPEYYFPY